MTGRGTKRRAQWALTGLAVMTLLFAAGCVEDEAGPSFANDPQPSSTAGAGPGLPTTAPATPAPVATPVAAATPVAIRDVLGTRGAVPQVFVASTSTIWVIGDDGRNRPILRLRERDAIEAIGPSPDASRVAAVIARDNGATSDLVILDAEGEITAQRTLATRAAGSATPLPGGARSLVSLDWSPQGDHILVLDAAGRLVTLDANLETAPEEIALDAGSDAVLSPTWSPTGEAIGLLAVDPETRKRSLMIHDLTSGTSSVIVPATDERFVVEFSWTPDGRSLLFTEANTVGGATNSIDLWQIGSDGEDRRLVAVAGSAGPVAQIVGVTPSPDGKSVAYAVLVPGTVGPVVDSVWVRDLVSGQGFRIGLPSVRSIKDIWWTSKGLAVAALTESRGVAVLLTTPSGAVSVLWVQPFAAGTPVAGPAATPVPQD
ncbi:MAG: WD40 repeat domain-containing protein [Thermomicrobiales bacterium]